MSRIELTRHQRFEDVVDRDHRSRPSPERLRELMSSPDARVLLLWRGRTLLVQDRYIGLVAASRWVRWPHPIYLGLTLRASQTVDARAAVFAVLLDDATALAEEPDETRWHSLLTVGKDLADVDLALFTQAVAVGNWHESSRYSPRSGDETRVEQGGWVRRSPADNSEVFPRTDPAVIVRIVDDEGRILLGSNALWAANRFSLLAGFVEPGESLESAVIREMEEESGLRVVDPVYLGSQPWPFPASLMCGFEARLAPDQDPRELVPDGDEILDLRWFSRDELRDALPHLVLPGRMSIARAIIEQWYGGPLDDE